MNAQKCKYGGYKKTQDNRLLYNLNESKLVVKEYQLEDWQENNRVMSMEYLSKLTRPNVIKC